MDTFAPSAAMASIAVAARAPTSTSSPSRRTRWSRPASKPIAPRPIPGGTNRRSAPSTGSWAGTIWGWKFTPQTPAAVAMPCMWTGSTATRAPNPPSPFCSPSRKCRLRRTPSPCSISPLHNPPLMKPIPVVRTSTVLQPDRTRVLVRPFRPTSQERTAKICAQVMALSEHEVHSLLDEIQAEFGERHLKIRKLLRRRFDDVRPELLIDRELSEERELLLGAHFTHEYSFEAAALFNPSIVEHPDQSEVSPGSLRFILSLRATGEGHISSITFRTGYLNASGRITLNPPTRYCLEPAQV